MKKIALMLSCIIIVSGITSCKRSFECACEGKPGILGGTQGPPKATIEIKTTSKNKAEDRCREIKNSSGVWYQCTIK